MALGDYSTFKKMFYRLWQALSGSKKKCATSLGVASQLSFYRGWYTPSNGTVNVVLHDLNLHFQDQTFSRYPLAIKNLTESKCSQQICLNSQGPAVEFILFSLDSPTFSQTRGRRLKKIGIIMPEIFNVSTFFSLWPIFPPGEWRSSMRQWCNFVLAVHVFKILMLQICHLKNSRQGHKGHEVQHSQWCCSIGNTIYKRHRAFLC